MDLADAQQKIDAIYRAKDAARGAAMNYLWLVEEVGELAHAVRKHLDNKRDADREANLREEFADVLAWLLSIASDVGVSLDDAFSKRYGQGCPYCKAAPCGCGSEKP